jgi:hypothetical protein
MKTGYSVARFGEEIFLKFCKLELEDFKNIFCFVLNLFQFSRPQRWRVWEKSESNNYIPFGDIIVWTNWQTFEQAELTRWCLAKVIQRMRFCYTPHLNICGSLPSCQPNT